MMNTGPDEILCENRFNLKTIFKAIFIALKIVFKIKRF